MVEGIILAGGYSSRAKTNKMLFQFNGKPLIYHSILSLLSCADHVTVVTGHYDQDIREALEGLTNISFTHNDDYDKGMFSSILCGIKNVDCDVLILPGDCPFVHEETIHLLLGKGDEIRIPEHQGKHGHPIFIGHSLLIELKKMPIDYNLKAFRNSHNYEIIKVIDQNILNDIDTLVDYQDLHKNLEGK